VFSETFMRRKHRGNTVARLAAGGAGAYSVDARKR